jgi:hypothetical protein
VEYSSVTMRKVEHLAVRQGSGTVVLYFTATSRIICSICLPQSQNNFMKTHAFRKPETVFIV